MFVVVLCFDFVFFLNIFSWSLYIWLSVGTTVLRQKIFANSAQCFVNSTVTAASHC